MITPGQALLAAAVAAVLLAGCGNGDATGQPTDVAQTVDAVQHYCSLSAQLDAQEGVPSDQQLDEIEAAAPPEIAEEVAILVEAVRSDDISDRAQEAEASLLAWEEEHCPTSGVTAPTDAPTP